MFANVSHFKKAGQVHSSTSVISYVEQVWTFVVNHPNVDIVRSVLSSTPLAINRAADDVHKYQFSTDSLYLY